MNKVNFTYNEKHEQICNTLNYRCPRAITATIEYCNGCAESKYQMVLKKPTRAGKKNKNISCKFYYEKLSSY